MLLAGSSALFASAICSAADGDALEEVTVTAQKRVTNLQDVPFSVAAASEEQLRNAGATNIAELARNIAGLTIADLGPGQSQVAIRGVSSGQVIRDQPGVKEQVGIYLDESPISVALFTPDLELFDLERFEVLRGPQGTLFGAGSESGTLRYITAAPKLHRFEGVVETTALDTNGGNFGGAAKAAVNLPLGDNVAARLVGYYDRTPGFIDAIQPGGSVSNGLNASQKSGGRIAVLFAPTDQLTITPRFVFQKLASYGFPRVDLYNILANPYTTTQPAVAIADREQFTQIPEGLTDDFKLGDLKVEYQLGPAAITSISSYLDRDVLVRRDGSQLVGSVTFDLGGAPADVRIDAPLVDHTHLKVFSQEIRLTSTSDGRLQWLVGGFYQRIRRVYGQDIHAIGYDAVSGALGDGVSADYNAPPDTPFLSDISDTLKQTAEFAELTWRFDNHWSLTGGLRHYNYDEDRTLSYSGLFAAPVTTDLPGSVTSSGNSPRAILAYKVDEDLQFNAQASRGFRLGGINDPLNIGLCVGNDAAIFGHQPNWKDEHIWDYELGAKMRFLERRVTLNVTAFDMEISDLQATTTAGSCSSRIVFNVPKARSRGVEAELFVRPNASFDFGLSATYVDAKLLSSVVSNAVPGVSTVVGGLQEGNRLPTSPRLQAVASVGYTLPLASSHELFANFTVQYVGSSYSQFENEEPGFGLIGSADPNAARLIPFGGPLTVSQISFNPELPAYEIGNLRVGVKNDRWEAAAFVNNLWDETARLALDYERGRSARVGYLTNQPRTLGLTFRYRF
jgi:iron complex outermembrane receptor protein